MSIVLWAYSLLKNCGYLSMYAGTAHLLFVKTVSFGLFGDIVFHLVRAVDLFAGGNLHVIE